MPFRIANPMGPSDAFWAPVDTTAGDSLYVGQLVQNSNGSYNGMAPLVKGSGIEDVGNDVSIAGVVIGTNCETPAYLATYGQYALGTANTGTEQKARKFFGAEGMYSKGDPQALVKVAPIFPNTLMEADIYNATVGVAPTVVATTAVTNATGGCTGFTTAAIDVATVANLCTFYCRTGANAGLYRVAKTAHATIHTFDTSWPNECAVGDTFVAVPYRVGYSLAQITSTAGYIGMGFDCNEAAATNYFGIRVKDMDLSVAGKEKVRFWFSPAHFLGVRTAV